MLLRLPFCNQIKEDKMYTDEQEFILAHATSSSQEPKVELSSEEEDVEEMKDKNSAK